MITRKHFHDVVLDGVPLSDFGVHVSGNGVFGAPEKVYEMVEVPGRSGDLSIDTGRFTNIKVKYPAFIIGDYSSFKTAIRDFRNYVLSKSGYMRLEDTYYPDEFRLAVYRGPFDPEVILLRGGNFEIEFECKPQRYLKSGEDPIELT